MADKDLQLVLVTPEKTLLNEQVEALSFPLQDGQIGILPGRAPMVGRVGYGELSYRTPGSNESTSYYVDGGFVQVKEGTVSLLTNRALKPEEIDTAEADKELAEASALKPSSDREINARLEAQERARKMKSIAK